MSYNNDRISHTKSRSPEEQISLKINHGSKSNEKHIIVKKIK